MTALPPKPAIPSNAVETSKGMPVMGMAPAAVRAVTGAARVHVSRRYICSPSSKLTICSTMQAEVDVILVRDRREERLVGAVVETLEDGCLQDLDDERSLREKGG